MQIPNGSVPAREPVANVAPDTWPQDGSASPTRPRATAALCERPVVPPPLAQRRMSQEPTQQPRTQADAAPAGLEPTTEPAARDPAADALADARAFGARLQVLRTIHWGPDGLLADPTRFVELATKVARCRIPSGPVPGAPDAPRALEEALLPLAVPANLKTVATQRLQALDQALAKWPIQLGHPQLAQELGHRTGRIVEREQAPTAADVLTALQAVGTGDTLCAAAHLLKRTKAMFRSASTPQQRKSAQAAFVQAVCHAIRALPPGQSEALKGVMSGSSMMELRNALAALPFNVMLVEYPALKEELAFHGSLLDAAARACGATERKAVTRNALSALDEAAKTALGELGIAMAANGTITAKPGFATSAVHGAVTKRLEAAAPAPGNFPHHMVHEDMWNELAISSFYIETASPARGGPTHWTPLVDRRDWNLLTDKEKDVRRTAAVNALKDLIGNHPHAWYVLHAVSRVANSRSASTPEFCEAAVALTPPNILPRGTRAKLNGKLAWTFRIRSDRAGGAVVRCEYTNTEPTHVYSVDKSNLSVPVERQQSFLCVTYEVPVTAEGKVVVEETPVEYEANAVADAWSLRVGARNPRPQVADHLFELSANDEMLKAFDTYLQNEYCQENLQFVRAVDAWRRRPGVDGARKILENFILGGAPSEVNIKSETSLAIQRLQKDERLSPAAKLPEMLRLLVEARTEIAQLTTTDKLSKFITKYEADLKARRPVASGLQGGASAHTLVGALPGQAQHDERWQRGHVQVGVRIRKLAWPFAGTETIRTSIEGLRTAVPHEIKVEAERRNRFLEHVALHVNAMDARQLAAIRVNLERLARSALEDLHVSDVLWHAEQAYHRTKAAQLDPKSVLLQRLDDAGPILKNTLAAWLDAGLVDEAALRVAFERLGARDILKLSSIAHSGVSAHQRIAAIATQVLAASAAELAENVLEDVLALLGALADVQQGTRQLQTQRIEQLLAPLAALAIKARNLRLLQDFAAARTSTDERVDKNLAELADQLQGIEQARLLPPAALVSPARDVLKFLGVNFPDAEMPPPPEEEALPDVPQATPPREDNDSPMPPPPDDADFPPEARWQS